MKKLEAVVYAILASMLLFMVGCENEATRICLRCAKIWLSCSDVDAQDQGRGRTLDDGHDETEELCGSSRNFK